MKQVKRICILYILIMLAALGVFVLVWRYTETGTGNVGYYTAEELQIYKAVRTELTADMENRRNAMLCQVVAFWSFLLIFGVVLIYLAHRILIRPVEEMEGFAAEIAKGNLEVPLPIHRNNMFGNFTESFDLMREEIKRSKAREMEAEKAKQEMVAELSHDLKTPVATIKATCEVLDLQLHKEIEMEQDPQRAERLSGYLEKVGYISKKSEMIDELVGSLFKATVDDIQEIRIRPAEHETGIIEQYFASMREYGNIILENHIPECLAYFDKLRMEQVIDNVVGNSYKYAGTDIRVSFSVTEPAADQTGDTNTYIKITIRDFGPGVPEEDLPMLTKKFYRGENAADRQGYGLGMYLADWYMRRQGGGMEYYNDHGFVVELLVRKV